MGILYGERIDRMADFEGTIRGKSITPNQLQRLGNAMPHPELRLHAALHVLPTFFGLPPLINLKESWVKRGVVLRADDSEEVENCSSSPVLMVLIFSSQATN